jgi:hypothetical protein
MFHGAARFGVGNLGKGLAVGVTRVLPIPA